MTHSSMPFGLGETKPQHYRDMFRIFWDNRDNLGYAWKVLNEGVCDGCALGTSGLSDWTIDGTHLCMVRLELLRLNTMGAMDHSLLADVSQLEQMSSKQLRELGRLAYPMRRRKGERGFQQITWLQLWLEAGPAWAQYDPERTFFYLTSRGITNEVYYVAQKVARYLGSNNVDNSARLCHSPSTAGLKATLGVAATTCSYTDFFDADVIVFFGSNPANDQPVTLKYLLEAKRRGAKVISVNAYREPGMKRYWIPSDATSALFGTKIVDDDFLVKVGGDLAFVNAVAKVMIERNWHMPAFVNKYTDNFLLYERALAAQDMDELLATAGVDYETVVELAKILARAESGIFVWSMGITQHAHGADTVKGIINLGMLRAFVGRKGCGMMPIRGHSGVQGGAEMGAYSTAFPGWRNINAENALELMREWKFQVPSKPGMTTPTALRAAQMGQLDALYSVGGNFLETMPKPEAIRGGLAQIPLRLHTDLFVTSQMLVEPADTVYLLPARTRYEQFGGGTETTTERRVVFSPYIKGHDVGEARSEWEMLLQLAKAAKPQKFHLVEFSSADEIRQEIARLIPAYAGIAKLSKQGDQFQWGGPRLCAGNLFPTKTGKASFAPTTPPGLGLEPASELDVFVLATRRGKQFNSMVQAEVDPLTGAERDHVFVNPDDARRMNLAHNDPVLVRNEEGQFRGRAFLAEVAPGTLQGHWPEVNVLIAEGRVDPEGGVPDYNARVLLTPLNRAQGVQAQLKPLKELQDKARQASPSPAT